MGWEEATKQLEDATQRLMVVPASEFAAFAEAMNQRSAAIQQLLERVKNPPAPIPPAMLERMKTELRKGAEIEEKLRLFRADARGEVTRLAESSHMMRSLATPRVRTHARLDCAV